MRELELEELFHNRDRADMFACMPIDFHHILGRLLFIWNYGSKTASSPVSSVDRFLIQAYGM